MNERKPRERRETLYDPGGERSAEDEHALVVSRLLRELQAHLERVRRGEASSEEQRVVREMVAAAWRAEGR